MGKNKIAFVFLFVFFALFNTLLYDYLINNPNYYQLDAYTYETDGFRAMAFGEKGIAFSREFGEKHEIDPAEILSILMLDSQFDLKENNMKSYTYLNYQNLHHDITRKKQSDYQKLTNGYRTILDDLVYFPIPENTNKENPFVSYEDSWGYERTYGGKRTHEGTDLMALEQTRGVYPVISMSDGVVENIGWLEQGGWRIGIRTPKGAYLYYAHLFNYARDFQKGDVVKAGDLLGFMGDSGYSKVEGTVGNFDVHLHLGLYIQTDHFEEMSVNPYWILKYLEKSKLKYSY